MASDQEQVAGKVTDMNGNKLRKGDLVMVILDKPMLTGFITNIEEKLLQKNPIGVITITGTLRIPYRPDVPQVLGQTAKLVDPRGEALVAAMMGEQREAVPVKANGPILITDKEEEKPTFPSPS